MKKILGGLRKAIHQFNMIEDGDTVAVGISGGKDSLLLFYALHRYMSFSLKKFSLIAININMGFKETSIEEMQKLKEFVEGCGCTFIEQHTNIAEVLFEIRQESNPCSLCSKLRRGALCAAAKAHGANKLALGHHANDVLETMFLSFLYEGRLSTFTPVSYLDKTDITMIRPFIFLQENDIIAATNRFNLPVVFNPCPADKHTKRQYMKDLIEKLNKDIPFSKTRMINAIQHPERYNLW